MRTLILASLLALPSFAFADDIREFAEYAFLSQYKSIEVARVGDGTGKKLDTSVLEKVQNALRLSLKERDLPVVMRGDQPDANKTLLLEVRLIKYSGGFGSMVGFMEKMADEKNLDGTGVTLYTTFIDKKLDVELGTAKVTRGGMSKDGNLDKAADALVDLIKKKMYDEEGQKPVPIPVKFARRGAIEEGSGVLSIPSGSNIAVVAFNNEETTKSEAKIVTELLRTAIVNMGVNYYNVLDRQYVDNVMKEHAFAASGATTPEGAAKLGKMLNAQKVVTGSLSKAMGSYFISANIIDVETGKIESAGSGDYKDGDEMKRSVQDVASQLIRME